MTKPTITKRSVKGTPLTYTELDTNFQNLVDATVTITGGSTAVTADLNGNITLAAGSNITITGNNTTKTITIAATGGGSGSGTVNTGNAGNLAYYPSTGTTVDDTSAISIDQSSPYYVIMNTGLDMRGNSITNNAGSVNFAENIKFPDGYGIRGSNTTYIQNRGSSISYDSKLELTTSGINVSGQTNFDSSIVVGSFPSGARPSGVNGMIIYNSTTNKFQGYANGVWVDFH